MSYRLEPSLVELISPKKEQKGISGNGEAFPAVGITGIDLQILLSDYDSRKNVQSVPKQASRDERFFPFFELARFAFDSFQSLQISDSDFGIPAYSGFLSPQPGRP